ARKQAAARRGEAQADLPEAASMLAGYCSLLLEEFKPRCIAGYWPIKTELDVFPLLSACAGVADLSLCLPITGAPETALRFHRWHPKDKLDIGPYNTRQPFASAPVILPDLILLPLLAFDENFNRLGYGGGFYDRTLASFASTGHKVSAIGIAYDQQQIDKVPTGPFDRALDGVLSPSGLRQR
ncbi:MAG: 5-formyltetrahydrofolate cyclo-ligase, partial [Candidatus Puniceispirillaceae bacterium]